MAKVNSLNEASQDPYLLRIKESLSSTADVKAVLISEDVSQGLLAVVVIKPKDDYTLYETRLTVSYLKEDEDSTATPLISDVILMDSYPTGKFYDLDKHKWRVFPLKETDEDWVPDDEIDWGGKWDIENVRFDDLSPMQFRIEEDDQGTRIYLKTGPNETPIRTLHNLTRLMLEDGVDYFDIHTSEDGNLYGFAPSHQIDQVISLLEGAGWEMVE